MDPQQLIQTAGQPDSAPNETSQNNIEELARELATLMNNDPAKAEAILSVIEGGPAMNDVPAPVSPSPTDQTMGPNIGPNMGPNMGPAMGNTGQNMSPEFMQKLMELEQQMQMANQTLGDYRLDRDLNDLRGKYGQLREHFGPALPEDFSALETPVLERYRDLMEGKLPPHEVAFKLAALEQALQGDGKLQERLIAAAAQNRPNVPTPEGKGGGVPGSTQEPPQVYRTPAERMQALRKLWNNMQQAMPGS